MLKRVPVLALKSANFSEVNAGIIFKDMSGERANVLRGSDGLNQFATAAGKALHGDRITILDEEIEGGSKLMACNIEFVERVGYLAFSTISEGCCYRLSLAQRARKFVEIGEANHRSLHDGVYRSVLFDPVRNPRIDSVWLERPRPAINNHSVRAS